MNRMRPTKWVYPAAMTGDKAQQNPILPTEESLKWAIYEGKGVLNNILQKLNWHGACRKEFMRWCGKFGLENDIAIARDAIIDKAETVVVNSLDVEDIETAKFVLKTAGKRRGWNEKIDDSNEVKNVYNFISIVGGGRDEDISKLDEASLVQYIEKQIQHD
jgi:hypothetical protein